MKKIFASFLILVIFLSSCGYGAEKYIPKGYVESDEHWDENGFQDYTDFCVYRYESSDSVRSHSNYCEMTENDIDEIKGYFSHFASVMEVEKRLEEYTFSETYISAGDYFYLKTEPLMMDGEVIDKYADYSLYYFDIETLTLYYIHTNI